MYRYRPAAVRVLRLRVKDKHAVWLGGLAREVNTVFNYCNELSVKVFERERRFLSGFDFWPFLKGVTRGDCALHLPVQAVQEIAEEYARRRRQHRKVRLAWRRSGGARRSLGWIPFKVRTIRYRGGQVYLAGRWLSLWDSYGLGDFELRAGNFSEDSRGRWYLNIGVPRARRVGGERNKPSVGSILDRSVPSLGIDLGLTRRAGPKGRQGLGMRGWQCAVCGAIHDRDVNAAHNILAAGHRRLAEGILVP